MIPWADICANRNLRDLPYQIETNRFNQIVLSPLYTWRGGFQADIGRLLHDLLPNGRVIAACAIDTTDGTKVPDVAWISRERYTPHRRAFSLPIAPEICVEVMSNSNTMDEMAGKMQLYFAAGAQEAWLCDEEGNMKFFRYDCSGNIPASKMCPAFPVKLEWE